MSLCLCVNVALGGGGWIQQPGSLYAKLGFTTLSTNQFHASDGSLVTTADFSTQTFQLYGEYGIAQNISVVFDVPFFKRSKFETAEAASGFGDVGVEFKYGALTGEVPVALGVGFGLPTGNEKAFARNLNNAQVISFQPTGDGEFNTWVRAYASRSFHPGPAFVSLDAGFNFRTEGVTNQYQIGFQAGYKFFDAIWLFGNLRRLGTAGTANNALIFNSIGVGEGVEYTSYGFGVSYSVSELLSLTADVASAFGGVRNIYSGANIGFGVAVEL
jgi:hypothetical protein